MSPKRCPTCKRPVPRQGSVAAVKVCSVCKREFRRHDKYTFGPDGRLRHRHCDYPGSYLGRTAYLKLYPSAAGTALEPRKVEWRRGTPHGK